MRHQLYINGAFVEPVGGVYLDVIDPACEEVFAQAAAASAADVDAAVAAARHAFDHGPWPRMAAGQRAAVLRHVASAIRQDQQALAQLELRDNGKPLKEALWDVSDAAFCFDFYADMAEQIEAEGEAAVDVGDARFACRVRKEPLGVVGAITPWNFPLLMAAWKVAPALAAGCSVVLKPSELCPLSCGELARYLHAAGLPAGVFNLITGTGPEAGAPLAAHPGVDKLAFTGSQATGSKIMAEAARDIRKVSLELGGKSPFIIFADADLDQAVQWIQFGIFWNQGQVCSATSRVLVQRPLYAALVARLKAAAEAITIGRGDEDSVQMGPLVSAAQHAKVMGAIAAGVQGGARLVTGGERPAHLSRGYFLQPTVFTDVPTDHVLWREEVFGPVVGINAFDDEAEAIALANDSRYGLAGAVMSADLERCDRVARALRAGVVWINCSQPTFTQLPWGGYKASGIGRELGRHGIEAFMEIKQITSFVSDEPWGWYPDKAKPA
ncbi:aldehyde dehydrogenase family protein [Paucibacter sp. KCTC 42545]|uniref:aldehyde dehydrogenase family protein n=1 Tax=Paucibacter sp. KCTC 42545 TaxID=1768242 RepID=UPI000733BC2F|nr:aldehyde dehydrogenase family protein [Paucibacter sp. KCTC 42545]ALT77135.1 aldehyde dehydrogenase [Paucibacter sp. KCTC 42545]